MEIDVWLRGLKIPSSSGIYLIKNLINNKKYTGKSTNLADRWSHHKSELRNNYHINNYLQNAWNKYGENAFVFIIIENCQIEDLGKRETFWIEKLQTMSYQNGYNIEIPTLDGGKLMNDETKDKIGRANTGKKRSLEQLEKLSKSHMGQNPWNKGVPMSEISKSKLSESLKGLQAGEKHHMFGKKHSQETLEKMVAIKMGKTFRAKPFKIKNPNGEIIEGENLKKFCKENNLNNSHIGAVIKGHRKHHKGWSAANE